MPATTNPDRDYRIAVAFVVAAHLIVLVTAIVLWIVGA